MWYCTVIIVNKIDALESLVKAGNIDLINVYGVPRSISTALGRSLNESQTPSLFVNEPFNRHNHDLNTASGSILDAIRENRLNSQSSKSPKVTVITKNMASYITHENFLALEAISSATIWSVRDPHVQMASLLIRMANDIAVETGADAISQDGLGPYIDDVARLLEDGPLSTNFSRTGWASIIDLYHTRINPDKSIVVDGAMLTQNPQAILKEIVAVAGLEYSDSMAQGWQNDYTNVNIGSSKFDNRTNAWTKDAANATGFTRIDRRPLDLESLPDSLRQHITSVAIPSYSEMVAS